MIYEAAEHVTAGLNPVLIAANVTGGLFWELADEKTPYPFCTFSLQSEGAVTKNGMNAFNLSLFIFARTLNSAAQIEGSIREMIRENQEYRWRDRGSESGYTNTEAKQAYIKINYEFKLKI